MQSLLLLLLNLYFGKCIVNICLTLTYYMYILNFFQLKLWAKWIIYIWPCLLMRDTQRMLEQLCRDLYIALQNNNLYPLPTTTRETKRFFLWNFFHNHYSFN